MLVFVNIFYKSQNNITSNIKPFYKNEMKLLPNNSQKIEKPVILTARQTNVQLYMTEIPYTSIYVNMCKICSNLQLHCFWSSKSHLTM